MALAAVLRILVADGIGEPHARLVSLHVRAIKRWVLGPEERVAVFVRGDQAHVLVDQLRVAAHADLVGC